MSTAAVRVPASIPLTPLSSSTNPFDQDPSGETSDYSVVASGPPPGPIAETTPAGPVTAIAPPVPTGVAAPAPVPSAPEGSLIRRMWNAVWFNLPALIAFVTCFAASSSAFYYGVKNYNIYVVAIASAAIAASIISFLRMVDHKALQQVLHNMTEENRKFAAENIRFSGNNSTYEGHNRDHGEINRTQKEITNTLTEQTSGLRAAIGSLQTEIDRIQEENETLKTERAALTEAVSTGIERLNSTVSTSLAGVQTGVEEVVREAIGSLTTTNTSLVEQITQLNATSVDVVAKATDLLKGIPREISEALQAQRKESSILQGQLADLHHALLEGQAHLEQQRALNEDMLRAQEAQITKQEDQIATLDVTITDLQTTISRLRTQLGSITTRLEQATTKAEQQGEVNSQTQREFLSLMHQTTALIADTPRAGYGTPTSFPISGFSLPPSLTSASNLAATSSSTTLIPSSYSSLSSSPKLLSPTTPRAKVAPAVASPGPGSAPSSPHRFSSPYVTPTRSLGVHVTGMSPLSPVLRTPMHTRAASIGSAASSSSSSSMGTSLTPPSSRSKQAVTRSASSGGGLPALTPPDVLPLGLPLVTTSSVTPPSAKGRAPIVVPV